MAKVASAFITSIRLLWPLVREVIWRAINVLAMAVTVCAKSVYESGSSMSQDMVDQAVKKGLPTNLERLLYYLSFSIVVVEMTLGWIIAAHLTVWLLGLLF